MLNNETTHDRYDEARIITQKLKQAVHLYHLDQLVWPDSLADLLNNTGHPGWQGPYIKARDLTDPWGMPYGYLVSHEDQQFVIFTLGKDATTGGDGHDADRFVIATPVAQRNCE